MKIEPKKMNVLLAKSIREAANLFEKEELSYYALTSKIENLIRDRLAYILFNRLRRTNFRVLREWKRRDIAILPGINALSEYFIELKATHHHSLIDKKLKNPALKDMQNDMIKLRKLHQYTDFYQVLLLTTFPNGLPAKFSSYCKYRPKHHRPYVKSDVDTIINSSQLGKPIFHERIHSASIGKCLVDIYAICFFTSKYDVIS